MGIKTKPLNAKETPHPSTVTHSYSNFFCTSIFLHKFIFKNKASVITIGTKVLASYPVCLKLKVLSKILLDPSPFMSLKN